MFRSQLREAKKRLVLRVREQQKIAQEISDLRELIRANANFLPDQERETELMILELFKVPTNVTEAVRLSIFIASAQGKRMTPMEVKALTESLGFDFSEYSNPMASIHTILKRMKESDPPAIDYDADTDTYWFGELLLPKSLDVSFIDDKLLAEMYTDSVSAVLAGTKDIPSSVETVIEGTLTRKLEAIQKRRTKE
jgi:hypothetical protein